MINYSDYIQYFQNLSQEHVLIQHSDNKRHFFRTTLDEVISAIGNKKINYPAVLLLPLEIRNVGMDDNWLEKAMGGFMILEALRNPNDNERREIILNTTRIIAEDFVQRIKHDIEKCNPLAEKIFVEFDETTIIKKEWGPVWDNAFGWSYEIPLTSLYNHTYNPDKWNTPS